MFFRAYRVYSVLFLEAREKCGHSTHTQQKHNIPTGASAHAHYTRSADVRYVQARGAHGSGKGRYISASPKLGQGRAHGSGTNVRQPLVRCVLWRVLEREVQDLGVGLCAVARVAKSLAPCIGRKARAVGVEEGGIVLVPLQDELLEVAYGEQVATAPPK